MRALTAPSPGGLGIGSGRPGPEGAPNRPLAFLHFPAIFHPFHALYVGMPVGKLSAVEDDESAGGSACPTSHGGNLPVFHLAFGRPRALLTQPPTGAPRSAGLRDARVASMVADLSCMARAEGSFISSGLG